MPIPLQWYEIALRLAMALAAGVLFGIERSERGRPAGLRTHLLVCLAAAVSMIQVNLLLDLRGKANDSFIALDLMRLPLGVLTGMGFIGGGAILRRGEMVRGVTTAATLWFITIIGLCFGGGQLVLGLAVLALGMAALRGLPLVEARLGMDRPALLTLTITEGGPIEDEVRAHLAAEGCKIVSWDITYQTEAGASCRILHCQLEWRAGRGDVPAPAFLEQLARRPGVRTLQWKA